VREQVDIGILIGLAWHDFVQALQADLSARGYDDNGSSYGYVFRAVDRGTLSVSELAKRLGTTSQAVTKLVNEMQAAGYVERVSDPDDARVTLVRLAPRGRAALAAARRFHHRFERGLVERHGERSVAALRAVLSGVVEGATAEPPHRRTIRPF